MAEINIMKAESFAGEPLNVDSESDLVFSDAEGSYKFTGFIGALCATGTKFRLQIVAAVAPIGLIYRARITVGYGVEILVSRMGITSNCFHVLNALHAEALGELLPKQLIRVDILNGGSTTFIPKFGETK